MTFKELKKTVDLLANVLGEAEQIKTEVMVYINGEQYNADGIELETDPNGQQTLCFDTNYPYLNNGEPTK